MKLLLADDSPPTAYFTAHIRSTSNPSHGEAVLFDDVQADSANAYDVTTRTYVIPHTGVYWVSVIVDALDNLNRATLELYVNNVLLGSADAADVSEGVFTGAFRLERGQNLIVRRGHDSYNSGNTLYSRTLLSLALVQAL
ncbi:hypothetical protein BaRGS_00008867 [Batillaria attramentaria]|uniref:C1q domain-containing protein n=1 Tax=Batillaria attramentaria TaxID=370345 RepID=A0ABD0LKI9_9CAEN